MSHQGLILNLLGAGLVDTCSGCLGRRIGGRCPAQGGPWCLWCFPGCVIGVPVQSSHGIVLASRAFGGCLHSLFFPPPGKL